MAKKPEPVYVIATYRVKEGNESAFTKLLAQHQKVLRSLSLTTEDDAVVFMGTDAKEKPFFVEIFAWKSDKAVEKAHQAPAVGAVWTEMNDLAEPRLGHPAMEFAEVMPV